MMAMTSLTGTSCVPSGTRILAIVPSSTASTSMVALSVSISAITSPGLTFSPSFLSHLARLPFSIVGESAGIRMLIGIGAFLTLGDWARRVRCRRRHVVGEGLDDALGGGFLAVLGLERVDLRHLFDHLGEHATPGFRVVEAAAQRHRQAAARDRGAHQFVAAVLARLGRNVE